MRRRAAFGLGLCAAVALGVALRLHTRVQVDAGETIRPFDSDTAYHLRRARFAAARFPRTILFDPLMNFPDGGVPIWPPLFDLALALPARVAHGSDALPGAVARGAAWVPVALAGGAILLAGLLGRRLYGNGAGLGAAVFLAVCPGHILWSQYGHADQHVAESFCGILALFLFCVSRETPDSAGNWRREAAAGLALALAVLTWQGAIFWGAIFALSLFIESASPPGRPVLRAAAWTLGLPAVVCGAATAAWLTWLDPPLTYVSFGYFQPLFLAALCGATAALALAARGVRKQAGRREALVTLALAAAAAAVTLPFAPALLAGLTKGIGYVAGATSEALGEGGYLSYPKDLLQGIHEAQPLLEGGPGLAWKQLSAAFFLAPIAILAWSIRARRGERPGVHGALAVWGIVTVFLALSQRVNVYYAAPLAALTAIEAARWIASRLPSLRFGLAATAAGLLLALPMGPGLREELAAVHVPGSDVLRTLAWMRAEIPHTVDAYEPGLLGPPPFPRSLDRASSVIAPWSLGHFLLYEAELPVVANNFGYGFLESIRFFLAETEEDALAVARRHRARWIVATDLSARMNDYASYLGRPPLLRTTPQGMAPEPAYLATLQCRLYDFGGRGGRVGESEVRPLAGVRLVHRSQTAIRRFDRWVPRWAVFEITDPTVYLSGAPGPKAAGPLP